MLFSAVLLSPVMLSAVLLSAVLLSAVLLSAVLLSAVLYHGLALTYDRHTHLARIRTQIIWTPHKSFDSCLWSCSILIYRLI